MKIFSEDPLFEPKDIRSISCTRRKQHIEKTIKASSSKILIEKARIESEEGWQILRKNKKSYRMALEKSKGEIFEDKVWCLFADMGFKEINADRNFKINYEENFSKQIDVFCKDDDCALVIECTQAVKKTEKRLNQKLSEFSDIKSKIMGAVRNFYEDRNLKVKIIIATENIIWSPADIKKAESEDFFILDDTKLTYFKELTKKIKFAARYQLLAKVFSGIKINNMEVEVPATQGKMGGITFYNFLIKPSDLLKIAYISHQTSMTMEDLETYQRMLKPDRLKKIGAYIDSGGQFPTNIVVNIKEKRPLKFEPMGKLNDSSFGKLFLPKKYAVAWIIDGQHRLYGFTFSKRFEDFQEDTNTVPVLAYENMDSSKESQLFVDINCEQQKVQRNLLNELYSTLHWESPIFKERVAALSSRLIMLLNKESGSPFIDKILTTDQKKSNTRCLTLTNFLDGLTENKFFGEEKKSGIVPGFLTATYAENLSETLEKGKKILICYFNTIKNKAPEDWARGSLSSESEVGFSSTNIGIRSLLIVLKEILLHIDKKEGLAISDLRPCDVCDAIDPFARVLGSFIHELSPDESKILRSRSSKQGVQRNALHLMSHINENMPDFLPKSLKHYLDTVDKEGTKESVSLINELQITMFNFVTSKLKNHFNDSPDAWWFKGVPSAVRKQCSDRFEDEGGIKDKEQYLTLISYRAIAMDNWEIFKNDFSFLDTGNKKDKTSWLNELNRIRNITHHAEKWPAKKEEVNFVKQVHKFVMEKMT
ncbi:hypothetical protein DPQ33_18180 [Oceanidesulfovibrio indonesiensis]|uniref:DGQHR domain-containing protein n=1 Tax=Oceanidesulfovibrio indonesiensis TaxID=54767 RepID=A0A7M3M9V1_9BACT|nr:DGQHR domain-containing protein [Oceanidesulfovibrio indonesiensis]TVM13724.1 hypothetical protein DPQ33_18180 [Oceanidesulfovibrio indonesiensis]